MRELLAHNISLQQQLEGFSAQCTMPGALKPRLREVTTLPSWMYCFMGPRQRDPQIRNMLAYARLVIRESQRHGGSAGWTTIDCSASKSPHCSGAPSILASRWPPWWDVLGGSPVSALSAGSPTTQQTIAPLHTSSSLHLVPLSVAHLGLTTGNAWETNPAGLLPGPESRTGICILWNNQ